MTYRLPNLHANWPFERRSNPYHVECAQESIKWLESFSLFPASGKAKFRGIQAGLLASLAYPNLGREHFRASCDLMNILFAMDDISDILKPGEARGVADIALDGLK